MSKVQSTLLSPSFPEFLSSRFISPLPSLLPTENSEEPKKIVGYGLVKISVNVLFKRVFQNGFL